MLWQKRTTLPKPFHRVGSEEEKSIEWLQRSLDITQTDLIFGGVVNKKIY